MAAEKHEPKTTSPARTDRNDRLAALETVTGNIEKQYGKGAIMRLGEGIQIAEISVIPTGSLALDIALGCGGFPRGRIV